MRAPPLGEDRPRELGRARFNAAARVDQILSRATPSGGLPAMDLKALLDARTRGPVRTSNPEAPTPAKPAPSDSGTRPVTGEHGPRPRKSAS